MEIPKCPTWYDLRGLGRSPVARLTVLIPIFGTLILFSDAISDFISISASFLGIEQEQAIAISRRNTFFLYFGLIIFSVSTLLFNARCPPVIKEFLTEYDHYDAELRIITKDRANRHQADLNERFKAGLTFDFEMSSDDEKAARALDFVVNNSAESREFWLKAKSQPVADLIQAHYQLENESLLGWRRGIYIAYLVAFALVGWPTVVMLWKVLQSLTI